MKTVFFFLEHNNYAYLLRIACESVVFFLIQIFIILHIELEGEIHIPLSQQLEH